ncbi:MAG: AAA family ATPase [Candidatus Omnitrophica bacterium]|nr:AAA family ATPase [Candidatus Omnitrophota bacterium]MDD5736799.1 AAA family ATPase [Candidatus Omnitrophota bacterium]
MDIITEIDVVNFRHLKGLKNIKIGERLTVIAGGNGTGKSSLLGLIGHVFTWRDPMKAVYRTIDNKPYETQFSEVFRFSPEKDYLESYSYSIRFQSGMTKSAVSRYVSKNQRFRIDVGVRHKGGEGKVSRPVIFLGLKRLIPLAQESASMKIVKEDKLSVDDKNLYQDWHNKVLVLTDNVTTQHIKSRNKELYAPVCDKYDALGNSAGQDNLAQIILAVLSFKKLKDDLKSEYPGGVLLIDEIETTLYPAAQYELVKLLQHVASIYDLQVFFTTHSIEIINFMLNRKDKQFYSSSEIIFLHKPKGSIEVYQNKSDVKGFIAALQHSVFESAACKKINVYLEDEEARYFLKSLLPTGLKKNIAISKFNNGGEFYQTLLKGSFPEFRKSIIVLDGDKISQSIKKYKNLLYLPGKTRPENVFYEYLNDLDEKDEFWSPQLGGYNKAVFLRSRVNSTDRNTMKSWFKSQKSNWGHGCVKLISRWKKDNKDAVDEFVFAFSKVVERLIIDE